MKEEHIHTWRKRRDEPRGGNPVFVCSSSEQCFEKRTKEELKGKPDRCPFCSNVFILKPRDLQRALPRCIKCTKGKKGDIMKATLDLFADLEVSKGV